MLLRNVVFQPNIDPTRHVWTQEVTANIEVSPGLTVPASLFLNAGNRSQLTGNIPQGVSIVASEDDDERWTIIGSGAEGHVKSVDFEVTNGWKMTGEIRAQYSNRLPRRALLPPLTPLSTKSVTVTPDTDNEVISASVTDFPSGTNWIKMGGTITVKNQFRSRVAESVTGSAMRGRLIK